MKIFLKKIWSALLAFIIVLNSSISGLETVYASGNIIKEISVDRSKINHAESFEVNVKFGGVGTTVTDGQQEEITFSLDKANIILPVNDIQLNNSEGINLGTVSFQNDKAIIQFNETAANLEDVEGEFHFNVFGHYDGNTNQNGEGNITISSGSVQKNVNLIYQKVESYTEEAYSKKGVWATHLTEGNCLEWVFRFNVSRRTTNGVNYNVIVEDDLPTTMDWDLEKINTNPYIIKFNEQWFGIEQAK